MENLREKLNTIQINRYCFFGVAEKASGGSREQDCQKAASDIFPSCHCCREVKVAEASPPSAESKITTTPANAASEVGGVFQPRRNNSLTEASFSRGAVCRSGDCAG